MIWPQPKVVSCSVTEAGSSSVRNSASEIAAGEDVESAHPVGIELIVRQEPTSSHLGKRSSAAGRSQAALGGHQPCTWAMWLAAEGQVIWGLEKCQPHVHLLLKPVPEKLQNPQAHLTPSNSALPVTRAPAAFLTLLCSFLDCPFCSTVCGGLLRACPSH